MFMKLILICCILLLIWIFLKWTEEEREDDQIYNDYSVSKPPLYVFYNTSGIQMPIYLYFLLAIVLAVFLGAIFNLIFENIYASILMVFLVVYGSKQNIIIRSLNLSQKIDEDCPSFLITFGNMLSSINNPILALEQSLNYADKSYQKTLKILHVRLSNGQDPVDEIKKTKKFFRNRILRAFLDDFEDELYQGNVFYSSLDKLIERAQDRKKYASERRIETFSSVFIIYGGIIFEIILMVLMYFITPHYFEIFVSSSLGKIGIIVMMITTSFMLMTAQKLIVLGEG